MASTAASRICEVVAENRAFFEGPLTPAQTANLFIPQIKPFDIGTSQGAVDQAQINIDGSEMDCNVLITHVCFHLVPPKDSMLVEGGVLGTLPPTTSVPAPVVPNAWTQADAATDGTGTLGLGAGQTLTKAYLDMGEWVSDFFYDFCRAYEWLWKIGNNILMQAPLTKIASIRGSAQPWTSGQHVKPFAQYVADSNAYLRANGSQRHLPAPQRDARRQRLRHRRQRPQQRPSRPTATTRRRSPIGGPGVQELCQNPTVYELCTAQLFPRGVKLGMQFDLIDEDAQARARAARRSTDIAAWRHPRRIQPGREHRRRRPGLGRRARVHRARRHRRPGHGPAGAAGPGRRSRSATATWWPSLMGHRVSQTLYPECIANESAVCDAVTAGTNGRRSLVDDGEQVSPPRKRDHPGAAREPPPVVTPRPPSEPP